MIDERILQLTRSLRRLDGVNVLLRATDGEELIGILESTIDDDYWIVASSESPRDAVGLHRHEIESVEEIWPSGAGAGTS